MNTAKSPARPQESTPVMQGTEPPVDNGCGLSSEALLRGQKAVTISHNGSLYRLQATRQGKLILTK